MNAKQLAQTLYNQISGRFVGREEEAKAVVLALLTKQHAILIGPPGTAKTDLIWTAAELIQAKYYYYPSLSKFTTPDVILGPIDPVAYKQGVYRRNITGHLPEAEIGFLDHIFNVSSETLNALLPLMNERLFVDVDGTAYRTKLWSLFGASNKTPTDSELRVFYDSFLIKHFVRPIDTSMIEEAVFLNIKKLKDVQVHPIVTMADLQQAYDEITHYMNANIQVIADAAQEIGGLLVENGILVSERTIVSPDHLPRLLATYAVCFGDGNPKKAAVKVAKYLLFDEDDLEKFNNVLDQLKEA